MHFEIQGIFQNLQEGIVMWAEMKCRRVFPLRSMPEFYLLLEKNPSYQTTRLFASFYK